MKILTVGCGSIGARHAANAALAAESAVFDMDSRKAAATGLRSFASLDEALAWKPDGVIVAVPHTAHIDIARQAVQAGADVLIEKPIAADDKGVSEFLSFAREQGRQVYVVCNTRFHPAVMALRENIAAVGGIYFARAQYGNWLPSMRPNADYRELYCAQRSKGGGAILDVIHEIDYLSWLLGPVESVICDADKRSDLDIDVEDYAVIVMKHRSGARSEIHLDYLQRCKMRGCDIAGDRGTLSWTSEGKAPEACTVRLFEAETGKWRSLLQNDRLDASSMYRALMEKFLAAIRAPGSQPDLLTGDDALHSLTIALAARASAAEGKRIGISS